MAGPVGGILERRLMTRTAIADPALRATLNLQLAATHFEDALAEALASEGLSPSGLNVLRILKGQPEGHPRGEISRRLIHRRADVTRIIDRLIRRGLVERVRSSRDRRLSLTRLTPKGHKLVARVSEPLDALVARFRRKLSAADIRTLNRLLEALYVDEID